jgi:DNA-binding response OmpR family regulator
LHYQSGQVYLLDKCNNIKAGDMMAKRILIVDDEADIIEMLKIRLESLGYDTSAAVNGEEALRKVNEEKPNLVLLDVMMPPPNGFQVCRIIKDDPDLKHIPVIMLTAKSTDSDKFWGMESGAEDYVTKPYNADELLEKIKAIIND